MPSTTEYYEQRRRNLVKVLRKSRWKWPGGPMELERSLRGRCGTERVERLLDAAESYCAANAIEREYPGPAILLYGAAVEALKGDLPDTELKKAIASAKASIKKDARHLWRCGDVQAVFDAAHDKASHAKTTRFMVEEFARGLELAGHEAGNARDEAKKIVDTTHDVRHRAKVDQVDHQVLFAGGGAIHALPRDELVEGMKRGPVKVADGPVRAIFPFTFSVLPPLCDAARTGCANAIASRVREALEPPCSGDE